ncbi:MAG: S8 family serine peptidase [Candidatus Zixiibacteriota bacterium]
MKYVLLLLTLLIPAATQSLAQSAFYYYDLEGSPVYLNPIDSLVVVRFTEATSSSAQEFAIEQQTLSDDFAFDFIGNRTFVFRIEAGYSLSAAMSALRLDDEVAMVNPVAQNRFGERWTMSNQIIVTYLQSTTQEQMDSLQLAHGLELAEVIDDSVKLVVLEYDSQTMEDITGICRSFYDTGFCLAVSPEIASKGHPATNDPYYPEQWQLENTGLTGGTYDADIDWPEARLYDTVNWVPHIIAVLDGGFQLDHEDLQSSLFTHEYDGAGLYSWFNRPDSNAAPDCRDAAENCWHGTAVLGMIAANTGNGIGLAGTDSRARIMPIKIADIENVATERTLLRGLTWARGPHGPINSDILSLTYNFPGHNWPNVENYLQMIYDSGRPIICSAGNAGEVEYPATLPTVLAVGMTDFNDGFGTGSAAGATLDVVAPGFQVWSLDLMGNDGRSPGISCDGNPNYTCGLMGTSFSAPLVAGIVARMLSANPWFMGPQQQPQSAELIYDILRQSADREPYGGGSGRVNDVVGWGRVNANDAVLAVKHGDADNNGQRTISDVVYVINYIFYGGPAPAPTAMTGDADCTGIITMSDPVYIINYLFAGGPAPRICPD